MNPTLMSEKSSVKVPTKTKTFRIGLISPLKKEEADHFFRAVEGMCELGFEVKVISAGDTCTQEKCFMLPEKYPHNFEVLENVAQSRTKILDNSDVIVFPGKVDVAILREVMQKNVIPVLPEGNGLLDFNPQKEVGNAFTFQAGNFWQFIAAVIRASENYKFTYDWKNLKRNLSEVVL